MTTENFEEWLKQKKRSRQEFYADWFSQILKVLQERKREINLYKKTKLNLPLAWIEWDIRLKQKGLLGMLLDESLEKINRLKIKNPNESGYKIKQQHFHELSVKYESGQSCEDLAFINTWLKQKSAVICQKAFEQALREQLEICEQKSVLKKALLNKQQFKDLCLQKMADLLNISVLSAESILIKTIEAEHLECLDDQIQKVLNQLISENKETQSIRDYIKNSPWFGNFDWKIDEIIARYWGNESENSKNLDKSQSIIESYLNLQISPSNEYMLNMLNSIQEQLSVFGENQKNDLNETLGIDVVKNIEKLLMQKFLIRLIKKGNQLDPMAKSLWFIQAALLTLADYEVYTEYLKQDKGSQLNLTAELLVYWQALKNNETRLDKQGK